VVAATAEVVRREAAGSHTCTPEPLAPWPQSPHVLSQHPAPRTKFQAPPAVARAVTGHGRSGGWGRWWTWSGVGRFGAVHRWEADAVAAGGLGPVEGQVGGGQELQEVLAVGAEKGHAHRDRHRDRALLGRDRQAAHPASQTFRNAARLDGVGAGEEDDELLAAEPAHHVVVA